jgi:hypothetical protein
MGEVTAQWETTYSTQSWIASSTCVSDNRYLVAVHPIIKMAVLPPTSGPPSRTILGSAMPSSATATPSILTASQEETPGDRDRLVAGIASTISIGFIILIGCLVMLFVRRYRRKLRECPHHPSSRYKQAACKYRRSHSTCCACRDGRPASSALRKEDRVSTYCSKCRRYWMSCPNSQCPDTWKAKAQPCTAHGRLDCLRKASPDDRTCCACKDSRPASGTLGKDARISTYCRKCKWAWKFCHERSWPDEWRVPVRGLVAGGPADEITAVEPVRLEPCCSHGFEDCYLRLNGSARCCACRVWKEARAMDMLYCDFCFAYWGVLPRDLRPLPA